MTATTFIGLVILVSLLALTGLYLYNKNVNKQLKEPEKLEEYFTEKHWRNTAIQLGIIRDERDALPQIKYETVDEDKDMLTIIPRRGDNITPYTGLSERLRTFTGALKADYKEENNTVIYRLWKVLPSDEVLNEAVVWDPIYLRNFDGNLSKVPIGIRQDKSIFTMKVDAHTMLIGASGAGKASVIWSLIGALKDLDYVQIWGIDLKRGIEFKKAENLFTNLIGTKEELVDEVLKLNEFMMDRIDRMLEMGLDKVTPTKDLPQVFMFVDEINSIPRALKTMTKADRDNFTEAWENILAQGRAAGISMFVAGQDPRASAMPARQLFQQFISLKTNRKVDQAMVFGDNESYRIADCSQWTGNNNAASGRGIMKDEELGGYQQFKTFYVDKSVVVNWNNESKAVKKTKPNLKKLN